MPRQSQRSQNERVIVGVTGRIGAGKTSVAKYLSSTHGFQYIRYSQVLSEWRAKEGDGRTLLQEIGWEVMSGRMQGELNRRLISQIKNQTDVAVDGLRHTIDYDSLKNSFAPFFTLVYIDSPPKERWNHLKSTGKYASFESFEAADAHSVEQQIQSLRGKASFVLPNESSINDLYAALEKIILGLKKEGRT